MKWTILLAPGVLALALAQSSFASGDSITIFADGFESGNLSLWTPSAGSPLEITNYNGAVPELGLNGAYSSVSADRMHHNLLADNGGQEVTGHSAFTAWIYDSTETRAYVQALGYSGTGIPNGGTIVNGSLSQLLAIGKNVSVSAPGEVFDATKYQARVLFGSFSGWFNLDGPGTPSRSPGWHKFTIERDADNTTLNFYVDDILSRTVAGSTPQSWDTITMGYGAGSTGGGTVYDGISVALVPEPNPFVLTLLGLGVLVCWRRFCR
jgi:hypothetical protein